MALSFRLAPDFLPEVEYPNKPFGLFFVIGRPSSSVYLMGLEGLHLLVKAPSSVDSMLGLGMSREAESELSGLGIRSMFTLHRTLAYLSQR